MGPLWKTVLIFIAVAAGLFLLMLLLVPAIFGAALLSHADAPGVLWGLLLAIPTFIIGLALGNVVHALGSVRSRREEADEIRVMQELYQGLTRLEERIEALETIIIDKSGETRGGTG